MHLNEGRRVRALLAATAAVVAGACALAPAAGATEGAAADGLAPEEVVTRFVAAVNARAASAESCRWLVPQLRDLLVLPEVAGLDPRLPGTYAERNRLRTCDAFVAFAGGYVDDAGILAWRRTDADPPVVAERTAETVRLQVPVRRRYDDEGRPLVVADTAEAFLRLEPGGWRIVWPSALWGLHLGSSAPEPTTLADLPALLAELDREAATRRAAERRLVRGYLRTRTPVRRGGLPWAGARSGTDDALGDAVALGVASGTAPRAANDLRAASLRTDRGTLALELRFRGRVPDGATVTVDLQQPGSGSDDVDAWSPTASWSASVAGGWASAWRGPVDEARPVPGARASVRGGVLRLAVPARHVRGGVRVRRPFRWSVAVTLPRSLHGRLASVVVDRAPDRDDLVGALGVRHAPAPARP